MADIQSSLQKMNDQEISSDAALSQALFLKLGANINGLIDRNNRTVTFLASGTWTCPGDVTRVTLLGAGGGGGGGTATVIGGSTNYGGAGGGGAVPLSASVTVVPNTTYTVAIGTGGAGGYSTNNGLAFVSAQSGGATSFGSLARFAGAAGSYLDANSNSQPPPSTITPLLTQTSGGFGSNSGGFNATSGGASVTALGGVPGSQSAGGQAGAGGGAGLAPGGNGGNGNGANATDGFPGGTSAGGGGAAYGNNNQAGNSARVGGKGGDGYLVISY